MNEQEQITALFNAYRSLVDELDGRGVIDKSRVEHNARELTIMPIGCQRLRKRRNHELPSG
jgi:hypothetical protein